MLNADNTEVVLTCLSLYCGVLPATDKDHPEHGSFVENMFIPISFKRFTLTPQTYYLPIHKEQIF